MNTRATQTQNRKTKKKEAEAPTNGHKGETKMNGNHTRKKDLRPQGEEGHRLCEEAPHKRGFQGALRMNAKKIPYQTYTLEEEKTERVLREGIPESITEEEMKKELKEQRVINTYFP